MSVVDRYLIALFLKILLVCFVSLSGLFVVIHLFTNLDEFQGLADKTGGTARLMVEFYGPRLLDLFDRTAPSLTLVAAVAALAWMQRRQELTAVEAAGVPRSRLFFSLVLASLAIVVISIANREYWIPKYRNELIGTLQNWQGPSQPIVNYQKDHTSEIRVSGARLAYAQAKIEEPEIQLPLDAGGAVSRILAKTATFVPATAEHPAGLLLEDILDPPVRTLLEELDQGPASVIWSPPKHLWLKPNQVFVRTALTLDELAYGQNSGEFSSLTEMIRTIRRPTQWYSHGNRIALHQRIVRPALDLTLLLVALPLALLYTDRNLFVAAMLCVGIVVAFQIVSLASTSLGSLSLIKSSALAAWIPLIAFLPLTVFTLRVLNR